MIPLYSFSRSGPIGRPVGQKRLNSGRFLPPVYVDWKRALEGIPAVTGES
jgi:hypothetical protein